MKIVLNDREEYRLGNGRYYIGTEDMDKNGGGFLFDRDYFGSKEFHEDFVSTAVSKYSNILTTFILENNGFTPTISCYNEFLSRVNAVEFIGDMATEKSRHFMSQNDLDKGVIDGIFNNIDGQTTKVIYIKSI